jgi:adenylate kinase
LLRLVTERPTLEQRLMGLHNEEGGHNNEEGLNRRLEFWNKNGEEVISFIEELATEEGTQCITKEIPEAKAEEIVKEMVEFIGEPHNYGPTQEELEMIKLEDERRKQEEWQAKQKEQKKNELREQQEREERERIMRLDSERLHEILLQEREMLEVKSAPLRNYLMENVIPTLTKGLIEVCQMRPDDPVDYLAEWLFKNNPVNTGDRLKK